MFYVKIVAHNDESMEIHPSIRLSFEHFFLLAVMVLQTANSALINLVPGSQMFGAKNRNKILINVLHSREQNSRQTRLEARYVFGFIKGGFKFMWNIQRVLKPKPVGVHDFSEPNHNKQSG